MLAGGRGVGRRPRRAARDVVVGSKNFTEQIMLGEMLAQTIERQTGLTVERRLNLGGTAIAHQALLSGDIDVYVEYTGTALTAIFNRAAVDRFERRSSRRCASATRRSALTVLPRWGSTTRSRFSCAATMREQLA